MKLQNKIGLLGGVGLVVGGVIGMGAYVLIPAIANKAGSAGWLAIAVAIAISLISVLPVIQISSALPVAGGGYMYASRLISPLAGTLTSFWGLIGGACSISLISIGLAEYFIPYLPFHMSPHMAAAALIVAFYAFYFLGLRLLTALQIILTLQMLVALAAYSMPVLWVRWTEVNIGFPTSSNFLMAVILAMNIALGFQIIIEMGEEITEPEKNIPLSLAIGAATIFVIYILILLAYTSSGFAATTPLMQTAAPYLPQPVIQFVAFGMISSALTSYNGAAITLPREIFAMSRDKTLPDFLSRLNKNGNPMNATTAFFVLVLIILCIGQVMDSAGLIEPLFGKDVIEFYGFMTIMGIMLLTILVSIAAWRLPAKFPAEYNTAYIRFPKFWLNVCIVISLVSSVGLIVIICTKWIIPAIFVVFTGAIVAYYFWRKKHLHKQGIEIGTVYNGMNK